MKTANEISELIKLKCKKFKKISKRTPRIVIVSEIYFLIISLHLKLDAIRDKPIYYAGGEIVISSKQVKEHEILIG